MPITTLQAQKILAISSRIDLRDSASVMRGNVVNGLVARIEKNRMPMELILHCWAKGQKGLFASWITLFEKRGIAFLTTCLHCSASRFPLPTQFSIHSTKHQDSICLHYQTCGLQSMAKDWKDCDSVPNTSYIQYWSQSYYGVHVPSLLHCTVSIRHPHAYNWKSTTPQFFDWRNATSGWHTWLKCVPETQLPFLIRSSLKCRPSLHLPHPPLL